MKTFIKACWLYFMREVKWRAYILTSAPALRGSVKHAWKHSPKSRWEWCRNMVVMDPKRIKWWG